MAESLQLRARRCVCGFMGGEAGGSGGVRIGMHGAAVPAKMGCSIVHYGGAGTGEVAEACNPIILGISKAAVSEAMNVDVEPGVEPPR